MTAFRYIHISDTHLCIQAGRRNVLALMERGARTKLDTLWALWQQAAGERDYSSWFKPASYVPAIVSGVAEFCVRKNLRTDAILITGDLATTGVDADLAVGRDFVGAPATVGFVSNTRFPTLTASGIPVYLMLGNHDRFSDFAGTPDCRTFERLLNTYMPNFDANSRVGYWVDQKEGCKVAFIYADFALQSRKDATSVVGVFGQGRVREHILSAMAAKTRQLQEESKVSCVIWAIHFAPFDCGKNLRLINYRTLLPPAKKLGVKAIICGHTHDAQVVPDRCPIYCGGAAGSIDREADARIQVINVEIDNENCSLSRENYVWDTGQHEFVLHSIDVALAN